MEEPSKFISHGDANHNKLNNLVEHCLGGGTGNGDGVGNRLTCDWC